MDDEAYLYMVGHQSDRGARGWGHAFEDKARALYQFSTDRVVHEVGVIVHPFDSFVGCSPDGLVGDDGGIEIKCPYNDEVAAAGLVHGFDFAEYGYQVQGSLWITGRDWWDCAVFDPRAPIASCLSIVRAFRDDAVIALIAEKVTAFAAHLRNGTNPSIYDPRTDDVPRLF